MLIGLGLVPLASFGHHSSVGRYDDDTVIEIEGVVTELLWRNPHVYMTLETREQNGERVVWELESGSATVLMRSGIQRDSIKVGDHIKVAGSAPLTSAREIFVTNVLVPSGEELLMLSRGKPRWNDEQRGDYSFWYETEGDPSRPELGLFRVWSHTFASSWLFPEVLDPSFDLSSYPLTPAAKVALEQFDRATDNPTVNCTAKGMPSIMEQAYPIEIVQDGNDVLVRLEEYDTLRTIHMDRDAPPAGEPPSLLGYSVGRWDGTVLVVTTSHVDWPYFDQLGIPQSEESLLVERFNPTADGSRLDYQLTVTDPVNFSEPVTLEKYWLYLADQKVEPYECAVRGEIEQSAVN